VESDKISADQVPAFSIDRVIDELALTRWLHMIDLLVERDKISAAFLIKRLFCSHDLAHK
jgi:hypothetical protein